MLERKENWQAQIWKGFGIQYDPIWGGGDWIIYESFSGESTSASLSLFIVRTECGRPDRIRSNLEMKSFGSLA